MDDLARVADLYRRNLPEGRTWTFAHGGLDRLGVPVVAAGLAFEDDYIFDGFGYGASPAEAEPWFPGDEFVERRIRAYARWNAAVMVSRAHPLTNVGGHIATYASSASLYEVGFNHFFFFFFFV